MVKIKLALLKDLQKYNCFTVYKSIKLDSGNKRGIIQISTYDNVELCWNGSVIKFWCSKYDGVRMFIDSNIEKFTWDKDIVTLHIIDCPESLSIVCDKYSNI